MNRILFALALAIMLVTATVAQDNQGSPSVTLRGNANLISPQSSPKLTRSRRSFDVPFCLPQNCLYYAGDFDSNDSNADGLFNANDTGAEEEGQVWVGVRPDHDVTVTGGTFVEYLSSEYAGTNPIPFAVQVGTRLGQAGKTVCNTNGNATIKLYGEGEFPLYSVTIEKLAKSCKLKKDKLYYVNLLPTSSDGNGWVMNVEDKKPLNHYGWKNNLNHCYFNGAIFNADYVTCNSQGSFNELSIALTGKDTK
jgi:hypothetical protein